MLLVIVLLFARLFYNLFWQGRRTVCHSSISTAILKQCELFWLGRVIVSGSWFCRRSFVDAATATVAFGDGTGVTAIGGSGTLAGGGTPTGGGGVGTPAGVFIVGVSGALVTTGGGVAVAVVDDVWVAFCCCTGSASVFPVACSSRRISMYLGQLTLRC